jgi:predicted MFS family arabinose efflux permease
VIAVRGRLAPLKARPFGRLLLSYSVNDLGDMMGVVALSVLVFDRTKAVVPTAAFFLVAKFLPALLAPALTARVDQMSLRRVLPTFYVLEALVFAAFALIADKRFLLAPVLVLGLLDGSLALTGRALTRGAVAAVLQPVDLLKEGNALMNVGFALSSVGGAALAGLLIGEIGLSAALLADAASFLIIAVLLAATRGLPEAQGAPEPWRARLAAGLRFAREPGPVRALLGGEALALICFTLVVPIEVVYAKRTLGTSSAGFGVLVATWGAGSVAGSLLYTAVSRRSPLALIVGSSAAVGAAYLGMAVASTLLAACLLAALGGAGNGVQWIAVMTSLQDATPPGLQARIAGLLESLGAAMPGVGYVVGGAVAALASPRAAFAAAGAGILALVVVALLKRPRLASPGGPRQPTPAAVTDV